MKNYTIKSDMPIFPMDAKSVVGDYEVKVQANDVSDGYHTMDELYDHREALTVALLNMLSSYHKSRDCPYSEQPFKSKLHSDGSMFEGYFVVGIEWKGKSIITYHYDLKYWDDFKEIIELERAPEYDGHTSYDAIERLRNL